MASHITSQAAYKGHHNIFIYPWNHSSSSTVPTTSSQTPNQQQNIYFTSSPTKTQIQTKYTNIENDRGLPCSSLI